MMKSTKTKYQHDSRLYGGIFVTLCVIVGIISHPVNTNAQVKTLMWTLQQIAHCVPLHLLVTYCISRSVVSFQLLRKSHLRYRNHTFAGILATTHALHSWYKMVKGEPIKGLQEVILIIILLVLPSIYLIIGGAMLLPHIPKKTDLIFIKSFVSMIFFCGLQTGAMTLRLLWVITAGHNPKSVFLKSLGKAIGAIALATFFLGFVLNVFPILDWLKLWIKGQAHNARTPPSPKSDKKKRSIKWFFWDLWFVRSDAVDSELVSKSGLFVNNIVLVLVMCIPAKVVLFLSSPPDGSGLQTAIQENNLSFLSMAFFMEAIPMSVTLTMMFDGSLVLLGRKTSAEVQWEIMIAGICMFFYGFLALNHGVMESYPQFFTMMMEQMSFG